MLISSEEIYLEFVRVLSSDKMTLETNVKMTIFNDHERPVKLFPKHLAVVHV
jgi:hypothetical protein